MQRLLAVTAFIAAPMVAMFATPAFAGPGTCDFIKLAIAEQPGGFKELADGTPKPGAPVPLKAYAEPVGWTACAVTVQDGGPSLACNIQAPQGRPAGEGKQGLATGTKVTAGCLPAG